MPRRAELEPTRQQYLDWLLLSRRDRLLNQLPTTDKQWGDQHAVSTRTLRRWRMADPEFQAMLEVQKRLRIGPLPAQKLDRNRTPIRIDGANGSGYVLDEPSGLQGQPTTAEVEYAEMRQLLADLAKKGDRSALKLWFDTYGKPWIESEQAQHTSEFHALGDKELAEVTLDLIDPEIVAASLARRGWAVART